MARVLIIDDDVLVRKSLSRLFEDMGHEVLPAEDLAAGMALAETGVDVVYLDLDLPDGDGLEAIDNLTATAWHPEVIVITGMGASHGAQRSLQSHAWDYIPKPASPVTVRESLRSALHYRGQTRREHAVTERFECPEILGGDLSMRSALHDIAGAARSDASVLVMGETGVGKELAARAIHGNSRRSGAPFVVVDCSSMTDTLAESVLHGHVKGSFTGAHTDRRGLVAEADGGTLFLDEIGELSPSLQKSFLRVLQERRYRPVGSNRELPSDFRVVAATHRDLDEMVREGAFRSDLLFRIRTVEIVLPPLRERGGDRDRLAAHFVEKACLRYGLKVKGISRELAKLVGRYPWPGNVRELANVMEAAVIRAGRDPVIYPKHLPTHVRMTFLDDREKKGRKPDHSPETGTCAPEAGTPAPEAARPVSGEATPVSGAPNPAAEAGTLVPRRANLVSRTEPPALAPAAPVPGVAVPVSEASTPVPGMPTPVPDAGITMSGTESPVPAATNPVPERPVLTPGTTPDAAEDSPAVSLYAEHKASFDRDYFTRLLESTRYDITRASLISGLSIPTMYRHLARAGIATKRPANQSRR